MNNAVSNRIGIFCKYKINTYTDLIVNIQEIRGVVAVMHGCKGVGVGGGSAPPTLYILHINSILQTFLCA